LKSGDTRHGVLGLAGMLHARVFSLVSMDAVRLTSTTYCFVVAPSGAVTVNVTRVTVPAVRVTGLVVQSLAAFSVEGTAVPALASSYTTLHAPTPACLGLARRVTDAVLASSTEKA
jgi:hypothetical protein